MSTSPNLQPGSRGFDLFAFAAGLRVYAGSYRTRAKCKQRARIDYRSGHDATWIIADRTLGRTVEEGEITGRRDKAGHPDWVRTWPLDLDDEPDTAPAAAVDGTMTRLNRIAWALKRLGRRGRAT